MAKYPQAKKITERKGRKNQVRIIAGTWRGRKIPLVSVSSLRPTPDRLRETLFNWLQLEIAQSSCLDLFAGSGVLGFEAASRNAAAVTMIEQDAAVFHHLQKQQQIFADDRIQLLHADARACIPELQRQYDIIFIDPPFNQGMIVTVLESLLQHHCLRPKALVYVESEAGLALSPSWREIKSTTVGQSHARLLQWRET